MKNSHQESIVIYLSDLQAAWAVFDENFYQGCASSGTKSSDAACVLEHYLAEGATAGCSPNRWFDESFYRLHNPELVGLIRSGHLTSGFEHYCQTGYLVQAPHWLFDPAFYAESNPQLTDSALTAAGFKNSYDHYLKYGTTERRLGHGFFDPAAYIAALDPEAAQACKAIGAFQHFLTQSWSGSAPGETEPKVSPHFDPVWYRAAYPHVAEEVRTGVWHSALHHYLIHRASGNFHPLPPVPADEWMTPQTAPPRIKIHVDRPRHLNGEAVEPLSGQLDIIGWAAANHSVSAVDVYVDGEHCGRAHHGIRTEGVAATFPELSHALFAGFRFIGPAPAKPGRHQLRIVARGDSGLETEAEFGAEFEPPAFRDGPWSLRRRMPFAEAELKNRILEKAGFDTEFVVVLINTQNDAEAMQRTMRSLQRQVYTKWRMHERASPLPGSAAAASDCWFLPLTPGDELGADALLELALHRLTEPDADFLYSDERRVDPASAAMAPFFKPDWSPELLLATDYIGRLWAAAAALLERAGLSADTLAENNPAGHANHDLVLRLTERAGRVGHVSLVLCESTPRSAGSDAIQQALIRREIAGHVEAGHTPSSWRIRHTLPNLPKVSVIIPTAGIRGMIEVTLHSLRRRTAYPNLEVIVVSTVPDTQASWKARARSLADLFLEDGASGNRSHLNNLAAAFATGDILLFLEDDVSVPDNDADPGWLNTMVEQLMLPGAGIVGPQLLSRDGLIYHAGMFMANGSSRYAFAGLPSTEPGPFGLALTQRNVSAVTGACLLVRRTTFEQLGGFDENLATTCSDSDFCLRCQETGLRVLYTPHATLIRQGNVNSTNPRETADASFTKKPAARLVCGDPFFNRHLSLSHSDYRPEPEFAEAVYPARPLATASSIRRILVIKLDHLGDFILSLSAIRRLKQAFCNAHLTLLAAPNVSKLAALEPAIDRCIPFEFFHARSALGLRDIGGAELDDLRTRLHTENFDLAADFRCHSETRHLLQDTGATWLAGFDGAFDFPWLDIVGVMEPDAERGVKRTHIASTLADFAEKIVSSFQLPATSPLHTPGFGAPSTLSLPPPGAGLRIALHPGAGNANKRWPAAHFGTLIDRLVAEFDCSVVLVGNQDEAEASASILTSKRVSRGVISAIGQTTLEQLMGLIASCDLFIGNDSGPHHLAACLGIPTIGIHSGVVNAREWSPLGPSAIAVRRNMVCSPCYLVRAEDCPREQSCLSGITPETVMRLAQRMLAGHRREGRSSP